ncbi:MAG: pilin [Fluviicoccus sp.]|uniref:pilin n=1 Tax=Fluviicoccus sp. TaxID=2003552 RepID=UPI00271A4FB9|nr:pilin [Fluviicoccus sp.]MDO8331512.1 pilin [Fluviicoccus sp.]
MVNRHLSMASLSLVLIAGWGWTPVARADFYKCARADGTVSFQDVPCPGKERVLDKQVAPVRPEVPADAPVLTGKTPPLPTAPGMPAADSALQAMSGAMLQRMLVAEGLTVASSVKVQVAEYYMTEGKLPSSNAMLGLPHAKEYVRNAIIGLEVQTDGTIVVKYNEKSGVKNGELRLKPDVSKMHMGIAWLCLSPSFRDIATWAPGCRYTGSGK